jgi:hypothetical protein
METTLLFDSDLLNQEDISSNITNIHFLFDKYNNNPYVLNRLHIYLNNLPTILENENKKYQERMTRIQELTFQQEQFYKIFLNKYKYFYMPYNNLYYLYDNKNYKIVSEDEILYNLLSTITDEGKLMVWKHKTKQTLIKKIKDRNLFKSVPETYTIQNILNFLNTCFSTKSESKYFLTVLGDCILKKNIKDLLFFIDANTKKLINLIDTIIYITTGNSILNNFILKYHDSHNLHNYRLIHTIDNFIINELNTEIFDKIGLDLLCVACHYSDRYGNSENYLTTKVEENIKNKIMYLLNNNIETIIHNFIKECLDDATEEYTLSWKNIHYIWKLYLSSKCIPNIIYSNNLKKLLINKLKYIEDKNDIAFTNITSKCLPNINNFLTFWDKYISIEEKQNNNDTFSQLENYNEYFFQYEIDELLTIYKTYNKENNISILVNEKDILKIINHFFSPAVQIIEDKYIINISCSLWKKHEEVKNILDQIIVETNNTEEKKLFSFDDIYELYKGVIHKQVINENKNILVVSKYYFEKCIQLYWSDFIKFDNLISL